MIKTRLSGIPIDLVLGGLYGFYNDKVRSWAGVLEVNGIFNKKRIIRSLVDMFTFATFFAPIYALLLYFFNVEAKVIISAVLSAMLLMPISGPLYGVFNDYLRKLFKVKGKEDNEKVLM